MKISIITATKDSIKTIHDNINSFRKQSYGNKEHVIMDCLSKDGTIEFLQGCGGDLTIISEADTGIYNAINKGLKYCTGEIIGLLHSDDVFSNDEILSTVSASFVDPSVNVVYGNLKYVDRFDSNKTFREWVSSPFKKRFFLHGWMPAHTTMFIRKTVFDEIGDYNENFLISGDYEFMLRLFRRGFFEHSIYLNENICTMRRGGKSNGSFISFYIKLKEDYLALRLNEFNKLFSLYVLLLKKCRKLNQFKVL